MKAVSGSRASFEPALLAQLGRFRHGVFVKHLKLPRSSRPWAKSC